MHDSLAAAEPATAAGPLGAFPYYELGLMRAEAFASGFLPPTSRDRLGDLEPLELRNEAVGGIKGSFTAYVVKWCGTIPAPWLVFFTAQPALVASKRAVSELSSHVPPIRTVASTGAAMTISNLGSNHIFYATFSMCVEI